MGAILVTGGAGFVGSHVVDLLIAEGHRVVVVDDLSTGKEKNINHKATFYKMGVGDQNLNEVFGKEKIEWVNHHAAQIDVRKSVANPQEDARINIHGLLNVLNNSLQYEIRGIIFASSGGVVYGEPERLPVVEDHSKGPLSPYGVSKLSSEYYLHFYHRVHGLPYIALRYGNVYGPRQDPYGEAGIVAIFTGKMLGNETPVIFGDGKQLRDYIFVEDVAQANILAWRHLQTERIDPASIDQQAYNIGTGVGTSTNQVFAYLKDIVEFQGSASYAPERQGELRQIFLETSKAERELAWRPAISLFDGLKRTVRSFRT